MSDKSKILVVDDEQVVCDVLYDELIERGYLCTTVLSGDDALGKLSTEDFQVVLLDISLPGMSGMDVLREIWLEHGNTATIMITAVDDVDTAVEAMKLGASDYLVKPFDLDRVDTSIHTALETKPAISKSSNEIDAIAFGVEARLDSLFGYSRITTEETIDIARKLGIAEGEIQEWAAAKATLYSDRDRVINSLLNKLKCSPLTQSIMGITEIHLYPPKSNVSQN